MITNEDEGFDYSDGSGIPKERNIYTILSDFLARKPYILCRTNKQVKLIQELGYKDVSTIHQAKGLEYPNVVVVNFPTYTEEDKNIMYVACTRAQNGLLVCNWTNLQAYMSESKEDYEVENLF